MYIKHFLNFEEAETFAKDILQKTGMLEIDVNFYNG